jgi:hypothetical protein
MTIEIHGVLHQVEDVDPVKMQLQSAGLGLRDVHKRVQHPIPVETSFSGGGTARIGNHRTRLSARFTASGVNASGSKRPPTQSSISVCCGWLESRITKVV